MKKENEDCKNGTHNKVVLDRFARDIGGRKIPGDCYCLNCSAPIPALWNKGNPVPIIEGA